MSTEKLLSLLTTGALHLARQDTLGDPWEGALTKLQVDDYQRFVPSPSDETARGARLAAVAFAQRVWISCWHANHLESAAMWDLYASRHAGVAVVTTAGLLRKCIQSPLELWLLSVRYVDYDTWQPNTPREFLQYPPGSFHTSLAFKRKSFEHEREVRIMHMDHLATDTSAKTSVEVSLDISEAVRHIYVAPQAPPWHAAALRHVTARFGLDPELVKQSRLYDSYVS
jgi:hypothetical protein